MKLHLALACVVMAMLFSSCSKTDTVSSPDKNIELSFRLGKNGVPYYSVKRNGKQILDQSRLGLTLKDVPDMADGFRIKSVKRDSHNETWQPVWGEEASIDNRYNEMTVTLSQPDVKPERTIDVVFRVFDDGIGFRYEFPEQEGLGRFTIMDELTEFAFTEPLTSWSIPVDSVSYYEGIYRELPVDRIGCASTPVTLRSADGTHMALHEANLTDYAAMNAQATPGSNTLRAALSPWSTGEKVFVTDTRVSPWRTLIIADNAGDMALSRIMLNLNESNRIADTSWIKPQRYVGVWWCYHMRTATWGEGPKHGATTANVKRYMDFAAKHNFGGVLVEGWNKDWNTWQFSFTQPADDFDTEEIVKYGKERGVELISHHETGNKVDNYVAQLDDAMDYLSNNGIHYVKTGYCGSALLNNKERHSSQYGVRHFRKVIETAAQHQVAIDNHEPVMPTGLQRTYPNLMTQEGVRGQEWDAWNKTGGNPPSHTVTLPFTRGLAGPMDFTPVTFRFENERVPQTRVNTTLAKQLALFVILYSPLQMASDMIENYEANPEPFKFVSECPVDWSKTVYPEAEIGKYVTVARKDKNSDSWFIGSATGDEARTATIGLSFLDPGCSYTATIYRDGEGADYLDNPYPVAIEQQEVSSETVLRIPQGRSGGTAIKLTRI